MKTFRRYFSTKNPVLSNNTVKVGDVTTIMSSIDKSVNWISAFGKGKIETRFVQKTDDYFIAYLSSHSGCNQGCRFCYLTQQNQTTFDHVPIELYESQFETVLNHYDINGNGEATRVNINLMARGEPLANKNLVQNYPVFYTKIWNLVHKFDITPKVNISTIMPKHIKHWDLDGIFKGYPAHIYYSMYTIDNKFREQWIPNAMDVYDALDKLKDYEEAALDNGMKYPVTFHWALIKDHNDSIYMAKETARLLKQYNFKSKFNLVRYNPHINTDTNESERIQEIFDIISSAFDSPKSYIVPRVGPDVRASCGMFIRDDEL